MALKLVAREEVKGAMIAGPTWCIHHRWALCIYGIRLTVDLTSLRRRHSGSRCFFDRIQVLQIREKVVESLNVQLLALKLQCTLQADTNEELEVMGKSCDKRQKERTRDRRVWEMESLWPATLGRSERWYNIASQPTEGHIFRIPPAAGCLSGRAQQGDMSRRSREDSWEWKPLRWDETDSRKPEKMIP